MPLKKTVAAERRMDLASFFCMIGRHGPAVALAVVAVVTVLAGFYIYRTVTGRRRKAPSPSPGEEAGEAPGSQRRGHRCGESTDLRGDGVPDALEDVGNLRRRPAAAEKNPPTSPPETHTAGTKPTNRSPAPLVTAGDAVTEASGGLEVQESCVRSLGARNQEEHEEVEETSPEEGKETWEKKFWSTEQPCGDGRGDGDLSPGVREEDAGGSQAEAGRDVEDQEAELGTAEVSDAGPSLPRQRRGEEDTPQCGDEVSESSFNGLERPPPEALGETSRLPPTRDLGSDPAVAPGDPVLSSSEPTQNGDEEAASSAGAGAESGISSLAVSPDAEAGGDLWRKLEEDPQTSSLYADDAPLSAAIERRSEDAPGPLQTSHGERDRAPANEDAFGHDIEDGYHRLVEQFAARIAAGVASLTEQATDVRAALEVVKTSVMSAEEGGGSQTDADCERTEISIMEATMDANEWITEATSLPPWLLPAPGDHPETSPLPPEQRPAPVPAPVPAPAADAPAGLHPTGTPLADENMEHFKKVVAVQPMPQNVNVTFRVHYRTQSPFQTVAVTGDQPELGSWKEFLPLEKVREGDWSAVVSLPTESHVAWKFVLLDKGEVCRWEECGNRLLHTGVGDDVVVHKWWGLV